MWCPLLVCDFWCFARTSVCVCATVFVFGVARCLGVYFFIHFEFKCVVFFPRLLHGEWNDLGNIVNSTDCHLFYGLKIVNRQFELSFCWFSQFDGIVRRFKWLLLPVDFHTPTPRTRRCRSAKVLGNKAKGFVGLPNQELRWMTECPPQNDETFKMHTKICLTWPMKTHGNHHPWLVYIANELWWRGKHDVCFSLQDSTSGTPVTMRVDPKGFYLWWIDQNNEMDILDIATIRDVRTGQYAKKPRVSSSYAVYSALIPHLFECVCSFRQRSILICCLLFAVSCLMAFSPVPKLNRMSWSQQASYSYCLLSHRKFNV